MEDQTCFLLFLMYSFPGWCVSWWATEQPGLPFFLLNDVGGWAPASSTSQVFYSWRLPTRFRSGRCCLWVCIRSFFEEKSVVVYSSLPKSSKYTFEDRVWTLPKNAAPQELFVGPITLSQGMTGRLQGDPLVLSGVIIPTSRLITSYNPKLHMYFRPIYRGYKL